MGERRLRRAGAAAAGVDGVLVLDLPVEEAEALPPDAGGGRDRHDLPAEPDDDRRADRAGGGARPRVPLRDLAARRHRARAIRCRSGARDLVARIRRKTTLPVALGFGLSRPEHVRQVGALGRRGRRRQRARQRHRGGGRTRRTWSSGSSDYVRWLKGAEAGAGRRGGACDARRPPASASTRSTRSSSGCSTRARGARFEIGEIKKQLGLPIYQPEREAGGAAARPGRVGGERRAARAGGDRPAVRARHRRGARAGAEGAFGERVRRQGGTA